MKTKTPKFIVFALLLTLLLALSACQGSADSAPAADEAPAAEPANTPVPETNADEAPAEETTDGMPVYEGDYATLTDADGMPVLAANAELSDDELDYVIDLKTGVTFADGTLMDADAVVVNFNRWFDAANEHAAWLALFEGYQGELDEEGKVLSSFDGIEKVNDFTVLVHLNRPVENMLVGLSDPSFAILSPAALENGEEIGVMP